MSVLVDTWSDYARRHRFVQTGPADRGDPYGRVSVRCARCGQTRLVWIALWDDTGAVFHWGCPRVPLWWRWRHRKAELPSWDVNTVPPWRRGNR